MDETYVELITFWWDIAQTVLIGVISIYAWIISKHKANQQSISDVEDRVLTLEESIKHVPRKNQLDTLHKRITESAEIQRRMEGEMHQMNNTLRMINEYLLKKGAD